MPVYEVKHRTYDLKCCFFLKFVIMKYTHNDTYFDGLVQDCSNSIAGALKQGKSNCLVSIWPFP